MRVELITPKINVTMQQLKSHVSSKRFDRETLNLISFCKEIMIVESNLSKIDSV